MQTIGYSKHGPGLHSPSSPLERRTAPSPERRTAGPMPGRPRGSAASSTTHSLAKRGGATKRVGATFLRGVGRAAGHVLAWDMSQSLGGLFYIYNHIYIGD